MELEFKLPIAIDMGVYKRDTKKNKIGDKKKPFRLNLNTYRNAGGFLLGDTKKRYHEIVKETLQDFDLYKFKKMKIEYTLFVKTNRKLDIANVLSIVDKYFCDSFVTLGWIEDDNYKFLTNIKFKFGGVVDEEYVKVKITEIEF